MFPVEHATPNATRARPRDAVVEAALSRLASGESLRQVAEAVGVPKVTVWEWLVADEDTKARYYRALEMRAEAHAEAIVEIAEEEPPVGEGGKVDPGWVAWQRNRIDARKWIAARMLPKRYGDRLEIDAKVQAVPVLNFVTAESPRIIDVEPTGLGDADTPRALRQEGA